MVGLVEGFVAVASGASESDAGEAAFVLRLLCDKANMIALERPPAGGLGITKDRAFALRGVS